jgi:hypothetical protein
MLERLNEAIDFLAFDLVVCHVAKLTGKPLAKSKTAENPRNYGEFRRRARRGRYDRLSVL